MTLEYLIHIVPNGSDTCTPPSRDYLSSRKQFCGTCGEILPGVSDLDLEIAEKKPMHFPISYAAFCGLAICDKEVMSRLITNTSEDEWQFGKLSSDGGTQLFDWVTFRHEKRTILRGSKHVSFDQCDECGKIHYFAIGTKHVVRHQWSNKIVAQSNYGGLLLTQTLFDQISDVKFQSVSKEKVKILDEPLDDLGFLR